jgi:hypothetical protein
LLCPTATAFLHMSASTWPLLLPKPACPCPLTQSSQTTCVPQPGCCITYSTWAALLYPNYRGCSCPSAYCILKTLLTMQATHPSCNYLQHRSTAPPTCFLTEAPLAASTVQYPGCATQLYQAAVMSLQPHSTQTPNSYAAACTVPWLQQPATSGCIHPQHVHA